MTLTQCTGYGHWPAKWEDLLGNFVDIADRWLNKHLIGKYECTEYIMVELTMCISSSSIYLRKINTYCLTLVRLKRARSAEGKWGYMLLVR